MELEGRVWKDGTDPGWLVGVPYLNVMTQGNTRKDALFMMADAIKLLMEDTFEDVKFEIEIHDHEKDILGVSCSNPNLLLAFALRRHMINSQ